MNSGTQRNPLSPDPDYSTYAFQRLLEARQWFEANRYPHRERRLNEEIQKRCAHLHEATTREASRRFKPYGVISGAAVLTASIGPRLVVEVFEMMRLVGPDNGLLWDLWALFTLPVAITVFAIGGFMDADRVAKQFGPSRPNP
jgi:hypothetical protein